MTASFRSGIRRLSRRRIRGERDDSWFYHPEMQARIAQAEADMREGRVTRGSSLEELMAHLDSLK
jgi:hypothetical protein